MAMAELATWDQIDRAESYLVCSMFDEASTLSSSVLKRLIADFRQENEFDDMVESAGMVLVQSLRELGKTPEIVKELKLLFGSITAIPVEVFLTGVCFQTLECSTVAKSSLEEFLSSWSYEDERYCANSNNETVFIEVDKYLEVVDLYVITLLALTLKKTDLAISWVNKAMLPVEKRQELLRRISSMSPTSSSQTSSSPLLPNEHNPMFDSLGDQKSSRHGSADVSSERSTTKEEILKLSRQRDPVLSWFPAINIKFGNTRLALPTGKILLASLLLLIFYATRKRHAAVKRVLSEKVVAIKKGMVDLWQLAFSYQVNPLAAVQPLPNTMPRSR